eukprot:9502913-Pyramimonas_sp.AAC.1
MLQKRRRIGKKTNPNGPSSSASAPVPLQTPSTRAYSTEHWMVHGDGASLSSAASMTAETLKLGRGALGSATSGSDGAAAPSSEHGRARSLSGGAAKPKLFNPKLAISIDDQTRERTMPSGPEVEAMEPIIFMEAKRLWAAMATHAVKGVLDPSHGFVKQLTVASQAVGPDKEGDLHQPTSQLIKKLEDLARDLESYIDKCGEQCSKGDFVKHVVVMDARITELDGQRKHVQSQLSGLKYLQEKSGHNKSIAYMNHYNRRTKIGKRLVKGGFGKEYADSMSRTIYASLGEDQRLSLTQAGKGSPKGRTLKELPFQGVVEVDADFDGDKVGIWRDPNSETLKVIKNFLEKNSAVTESKIK